VDVQTKIEDFLRHLNAVFAGKPQVTRLCLTAILANGHVLLEDVPGTGKTLLARSIAQLLGGRFSRIQFTPDMLPSDIMGFSMYHAQKQSFEFVRGAVFCNVLLGDEINRTTPRTQSALLECMEERQVTVDGNTYRIEEPFFVIATQNPIEQQGVYPLPEAQLDRFLMQLHIGYPDIETEIEIVRRREQETAYPTLPVVLTAAEVIELRRRAAEATVRDEVRHYAVSLVRATRQQDRVTLGASPRAAVFLMRAAKAYALTSHRSFVTPQDVQDVALPVLSHRVRLKLQNRLGGTTPEDIIRAVTKLLEVPVE